jgi:outer membrane protein OmpA-like peptidoglycan-associated protein
MPTTARRVLACASLAALIAACTPTPDDPVGVGAVSAATAEQAQPVLGLLGEAAVRAAAESDRGTFTLLVAGAPGGPSTAELVARRERAPGSPVERGPQRAGLIDDLVDVALGQVAQIAAPDGEPDLLDAIAEGTRGEPGTLLVLDAGVSTIDPLDLRALGWAADPVAVATDLRDRDQLPDLREWDVVFVGLGRTAGDQPDLGLPQQRWLERLWTTLCQAAGARSCVVDADPHAVAAPLSTRSAPPVDIPAVTTHALPGDGIEITLPDARLGFTPGSADLAPEAGDVLHPIVDAYRPGLRIEVTGVVAFWGDEAYRSGLSQDRADAVGAWLIEHGVPADAVVAVGAGAIDGPAASTTGGAFDESKVTATGIRRVVVTVSRNLVPGA